MAAERWFLDGWEVTQGVVRNVEFRTGLNIIPGVQGVNAQVSNRTGEVWARKSHAAGLFTLNVWMGNNTTDVYDHWEELTRAAAHVHRLVAVTRVMPDGETRYCDAELISSVPPQHLGVQGMRAGLEFRIPSSYWRGAAVFQHGSAPGQVPQVMTLDGLAASTAPMLGAVIDFAGPQTNPRITDWTDGIAGDSLTYNAVIPAGGVLTINSGSWTASSTGTVGFDVLRGMLVPSGPRYLTIPAARPGEVPRVRWTADAVGGSASMSVASRRAYLC